jgi:hypothetical protein
MKTIKKFTSATQGKATDHFFSQLAKDLAQSVNRRSLLLIGWLLLATPVAVQAQSDYLTRVTDGTVTITGYTGTERAVSIPSQINSLPVTRIGSSAFAESGLTSVTIPNSVSSIGDYAFFDCNILTTITVDSANPNYSSIGGVLFDKGQATLIQYPGGKVGSYTIPNSVTNIGDGAFSQCYSLTNVTITGSLTSIGDQAFVNCLNLISVTIPNSVNRIGDGAFLGCASLTNVTIPNSVNRIGDGAFYGCGSLTSVTIPNCATSIGSQAFYSCRGLTSVTIPSSVSYIGDLAFVSGDPGLTNVYFQGNAPSLGLMVFGGGLVGLDNATAYYLPGTTGWGSTFGGIPTALWSLPYPLILNSSLGVQSNQFGFTVSWATNLSVVVEAAIDLGNPAWSVVGTNTLNGGTLYFTDPQWMKYSSRFYRVRSLTPVKEPTAFISQPSSPDSICNPQSPVSGRGQWAEHRPECDFGQSAFFRLSQ